ncbi:acyl-CoA carboxylase subunit epsilon [Nocardioides sp. CER28]
MSGSEPDAAPVLHVVNPDAAPEEIAAIVAVFASLGGGESAPEPPRSEWANPERAVRATTVRALAHGRGAWRASGLPR